MAHCVGSQGQVKLAKKLQKHASIMMSHTENPKPTINLFQSELLSESVDVLNSSLTQSAGELQRCKGFQKRWCRRFAFTIPQSGVFHGLLQTKTRVLYSQTSLIWTALLRHVSSASYPDNRNKACRRGKE